MPLSRKGRGEIQKPLDITNHIGYTRTRPLQLARCRYTDGLSTGAEPSGTIGASYLPGGADDMGSPEWRASADRADVLSGTAGATRKPVNTGQRTRRHHHQESLDAFRRQTDYQSRPARMHVARTRRSLPPCPESGAELRLAFRPFAPPPHVRRETGCAGRPCRSSQSPVWAASRASPISAPAS